MFGYKHKDELRSSLLERQSCVLRHWYVLHTVLYILLGGDTKQLNGTFAVQQMKPEKF